MLEPTPTPTGASSADAIRREQRQRWQRGERPQVEEFLERYPALSADTEGLLDLIYAEVVLREQAGETPQLGEYLTRFPAYSEALRVQFEVHSALDAPGGFTPELGSLTRGEAVPSLSDAAAFPPGYELLGELGRGGMGIVWKARHLRLNRTVALKMLRHGPEARTEELRRFRVEADAVARLSHANIVQIYEVGDHQDRPFLALEYVEGPSLAQQLALAPLTPRAAAALVEVLAHAMHYAHERAVVHRDLKPANVLLTHKGEPKITDFGLAKRLDLDTGQTQSGMLIGTPSYMAPEQAGARTGNGQAPLPAAPAADLYALGAVLYECLTGRPPFRGVTPLDTLLLVRTQEPVPPAQLQPQCPRDLDIICLKCLEKAPARRYASAADLAEDLRRFLAGEPIRARPTPRWERALKWARRRPAAAAAVLSGVLLLAALVGFTAALQVARARAESNFERAFQAVDEFFVQVTEDRKLRQHDLRPLLHRLLQKAQPYYEELIHQEVNDPRLQAKQAKAHRRLAEILAEITDRTEALDHAQRAVTLLRTLAARREDPEYRRELAVSLALVGDLNRHLGQYPQALAALTEARDLRENLHAQQADHAEDQAALARSLDDLGIIQYYRRDWEGARQALDAARGHWQALASRGKQSEHLIALADSWNNLGLLERKTNRPAAAAQAYRTALQLRGEVGGEAAADPDFRLALAKGQNNLGGVHRQAHEWDEAHRHFAQAIAMVEQLQMEHPSVLEYRAHLALFTYNGALLWHQRGDEHRDLARARGHYETAVKLWESLPASFQREPTTLRRRADCHYEWGKCEQAARQPAAASDLFSRAAALYESVPAMQLVEEERLNQEEEDRLRRMNLLHHQGHAQADRQEWAAAGETYRQALALRPTAGGPSREFDELSLLLHAKLAECRHHERQWAETVTHAEQALTLGKQFPAAGHQQVRLLARTLRALAWAQGGESVRARKEAEAIEREEADWQKVSYRLARIHALLAAAPGTDDSQRLQHLTTALRQLRLSTPRFKTAAHIDQAAREPDLRTLHDLPEFRSWLESLRGGGSIPEG